MVVVNALGEYILGEWIWSVSLGALHLPLSLIFIFCLFTVQRTMRFTHALIIVPFSGFVAFVSYGIVVGVGLMILQYIPRSVTHEYFFSTVDLQRFMGYGLAAIYSLFEIMFFSLLRRYHNDQLPSVFWTVIISNGLAACMARFFMYI